MQKPDSPQDASDGPQSTLVEFVTDPGHCSQDAIEKWCTGTTVPRVGDSVHLAPVEGGHCHLYRVIDVQWTAPSYAMCVVEKR